MACLHYFSHVVCLQMRLGKQSKIMQFLFSIDQGFGEEHFGKSNVGSWNIIKSYHRYTILSCEVPSQVANLINILRS